jgi:flagellar biosynthetic protein FlhB
MADEDPNSGADKTEEPTQRRIQEAVKRGQVAFSREVTNFLMLLVLTLSIVWFAPYIFNNTRLSLFRFIESPHTISLDGGNLQRLTAEIIYELLALLALPILATMLAALISSFMQNGIVFSAEPIKPKLEKISPIKGLKRLFSMRSLMEFFKGLLKITIVGIVGFIVVWPQLGTLENLADFAIMDMLTFLGTLAFRMALGATMVMAIIAVIDYIYQRYEYIKQLRMTRQELKEEFKQTEGDPTIKARLRQIRMDRARQRMMAAVPEADVIITNPTHYAIALKYDRDTMPAPITLALGADNIALKIRELGEEHDIPIVENPPLARALFDVAEMGQEIPFEFYQAVAEVIGYVYNLKGKSA